MLVEKQAVAAGVKSAGSSGALINILQLLQLVVLARLLAPSDFGLMGMATVVIGFANLFADMGTGSAIVHRQDVTKKSLSTLYWLNMLLGFTVFCVMWAVTPLVVAIYSEPRLGDVMFWVSLLFLIAPIGQQFQVLLEKKLEFGLLAKIEVTAASVGTIVAIAMALTGSGVFALVWGALANSGAKALMLAVIGWKRWRPSPFFRLNDLQGYLGFGLYHVGQRSVNYITANVDFLLIGRFLGPQALGYYTLAYHLVNLPSSRLNAVIARVFFPVFAQVQNDNIKLRHGYLRMQEFTSMVSIPILLGMAVVAPVAVPFLFGNSWAQSILLVQILTVVGLSRSIAGTVGPLLLAKGRTDLGFKWSLLIVAIQIPGISVGVLSGSTVGVAVAFAILACFYFALNYFILIRTLLGSCLKDYGMTIWPFFWMSLIMGGMMVGISVISASMRPPLLLAVQIASGLSVYVALVWYKNKQFLIEMSQLVFDRRGV